MKKIILILAVFFFLPHNIYGEGGIAHSLRLYCINNTELRNNIFTYVIPFLINEKYLSSEYVLNVTFQSHLSNKYIYVSVIEKNDLVWNDKIIGYTNIAGYTCILYGNNNKQFIYRFFLNHQKRFIFNNPELSRKDGTIEWLFRLDEDKIKIVHFISEW